METINTIYINRKFNCNSDELFKWLVEPDLFNKWFGPGHLQVVNVEINLCVGKTFRIELSKPDGKHFFIEGNYIQIEAPTTLVFSFKYTGLEYSPPESIVKISLQNTGLNESELSLIQEFKTDPKDMENRTIAWQKMLTRLSGYINR